MIYWHSRTPDSALYWVGRVAWSFGDRLFGGIKDPVLSVQATDLTLVARSIFK